ncbi:MAG: hypothetical protein JWQ48_4183 [Conexibacter sp.]|nr:hypothetical protein [Conexibacter sp.]
MTVAEDGVTLDGIVFHAHSILKVVVAVADPERGPLFRTVHSKTLAERDGAGAHDEALRRLIRRTPSAGRGGPRGGQGGGRGRPGHTRSAGHRTTGK